MPHSPMGAALQIAETPNAAWCLMVPLRRQILSALAEPNSAAGLARDLGVTRQKINYHMRELEKAGFVTEAEKRVKGNCVERVMRSVATTYLVHPAILDAAAGDIARGTQDRFSAEFLAEAAAQVVRDLAELRPAAEAARQRLATLTQLTEVRFASAADRKAFSDDLTVTLAKLVEKYHASAAPGGRTFRLLAAAWPAIRRQVG